jgi:hypothetical protein
MSPVQDLECISEDVDRLAVKTGRALAESYAANFTNYFEEITFEQQRVVEYIFTHAAAEALEKIPAVKDVDKFALRNRTMVTVKTAFKTRLAELQKSKS